MKPDFNILTVYEWPNVEFHNAIVDPANFEIFAPHGTGFYGYQHNQILNPFDFAPVHEPGGGLIFFDSSDLNLEKLLTFFKILNIDDTQNYYAIIKNSKNPIKDGYLQQMRIISDSAMRSMFQYEYPEKRERQAYTIPGALFCFIDFQTQKWGTSCFKNKGLWGKFGGDGYFGKEQLSFGLMIENSHFGVYRIWSRAWLVTK